MTGESDEMKKDTIKKCEAIKSEKDQEKDKQVF